MKISEDIWAPRFRCQMRDKRFVFLDPVFKNPFWIYWAQFIRSLVQAFRHHDNLSITPHPRQPGTRKHIPASQLCASKSWRGKPRHLWCYSPSRGTQERQGIKSFSPESCLCWRLVALGGNCYTRMPNTSSSWADAEITPKLLCFLSEITRNCLMDEDSVALRSKYIADGNLLLKLRYFWEEHFLT